MSPGESYGQLDLIWNSQLIGRYKEMSPGESYIWNLVEHRVNSLLFQCSQWELIWTSELIAGYKEMSPGESYIWKWLSTEWTLHFSMQSMRAQLAESTKSEDLKKFHQVNLTIQWELIWNSQLIGRYQEMSPGESYIWNWQSSEWSLCFSMQSMRAHLKQSTHRKI